MTTKFQQSIWTALTMIPQGRVTTYGSIAKHLGTKAVRAVGTAVGKNPNVPRVPCHRVVRADGSVGKYSGAGGQIGKIKILKKEGIEIKDNKIQNFKEILFNF